MKKLAQSIVGSVCLFAILSGGVVAATDSEIGMVDTHYILQHSKRVESEKKKLEGQFASRREALMKLQGTLKTDVDALHKHTETLHNNGPVMKKAEKSKMEAEKAALEKKIADEQMTLQNDQMQFQKAVYEAQGKVMHALSGEMDAAIDVCAKQKGVRLVLHRSALASVGTANKEAELALKGNITKCVQEKFK